MRIITANCYRKIENCESRRENPLTTLMILAEIFCLLMPFTSKILKMVVKFILQK